MAPSSFAPDVPRPHLLLERSFLAGIFISAIGFGAEIVFYFFCIIYLWSRRNKNLPKILLGYLTVIFFLELALISIQAYTTQAALIDHRRHPGGLWGFFQDLHSTWLNVVFYALLFTITFLFDLLVLWRCWVTWSASAKWKAVTITFFPMVLLSASFVMGILWIIEASKPGFTVFKKLIVAYGTSYLALSIAVNIFLTILIVVRLLLYQRRSANSPLPPEFGKPYISMVTIFVESAASYSIFGIIFLITYAVDHPSNLAFLAVASNSQQIAGYLIIYRLVATTSTCNRSSTTSTLMRPRSSSWKSHSGKKGCRMSSNFSADIQLNTAFHSN
ncbi:hypothetical protein VKT23_015963 [Stygiomarasmius scandens]|uniref:Uncharacterized protein n=1 Tax=Marasmiellus scandens TaxID=2682957 RepID=A0ABR1J0I6_9AGAR